MVSNFNLVFTDHDIISQIINKTKPYRKIYKLFDEVEDEPNRIIHICDKFYKMKGDRMEFSMLLHRLKILIDGIIDDFNFGEIGKGNMSFPITDEPSYILDDEKGNEDILNHKYKSKDIIKWIKENFKYLVLKFNDPKNIPNIWGTVDKMSIVEAVSDYLNSKELFEGFNHCEFTYFCPQCDNWIFGDGDGAKCLCYYTYHCHYGICNNCIDVEIDKLHRNFEKKTFIKMAKYKQKTY